MPRKNKKMWVYSPPKQPKPKVPETEKQLISDKCNELIETELKPKHIKPPPTDNEWNYLVDIFGKWYRNYFYFYSTCNCPSPRAIKPSFEDKFARLEYTGKDSFNIAYMRHTGKWWEIFQGLTLEQCLEEMKNNVILHPH